MRKNNVFLASSVLIAGIVSAQGAARALLLLGEDRKIQITLSEQVITEVERNIARKAPKALPFLRETILRANVSIQRDPPVEEVLAHQDWIKHPADVPILVAAVLARVDYLATLNRKHFIDDAKVVERSGLRIGTPGDALAWVREQLFADSLRSD